MENTAVNSSPPQVQEYIVLEINHSSNGSSEKLKSLAQAITKWSKTYVIKLCKLCLILNSLKHSLWFVDTRNERILVLIRCFQNDCYTFCVYTSRVNTEVQ